MNIFKNGSPKELLQFMKNENKFIKDTGTTVVVGRINFLHKLIHGKFILDMESMEDIREDYIFLWYKVEQKGFFFVPFVEFVTTNFEVI